MKTNYELWKRYVHQPSSKFDEYQTLEEAWMAFEVYGGTTRTEEHPNAPDRWEIWKVERTKVENR